MNKREIHAGLKRVPSWIDYKHTTVGEAFAECMRGKSYGYEPLLDAWCWFLKGWQKSRIALLKRYMKEKSHD